MEMRSLNALMVKVNSKPETPAPRIIPVPVPETAFQRIMERVRLEERFRKHDTLVRKLLGNRAKKRGAE